LIYNIIKIKELPLEICNLKNLTSFECYYNLFEHVPVCIKKLLHKIKQQNKEEKSNKEIELSNKSISNKVSNKVSNKASNKEEILNYCDSVYHIIYHEL
jgi:hypothetical protein